MQNCIKLKCNLDYSSLILYISGIRPHQIKVSGYGFFRKYLGSVSRKKKWKKKWLIYIITIKLGHIAEKLVCVVIRQVKVMLEYLQEISVIQVLKIFYIEAFAERSEQMQ